MVEGTVHRRLAAILAADVVGFSKLMGQDEEGTLAALKALWADLVDIRITEQGGRIFKETGDGVLAEFPSVVNATACAVDIQRAVQASNADLPEGRAIQLRIGVNVGDVIVEGDDIFGDGVNVAARLEGIAPPGGVAISGAVRDHIGNKLDVRFEDMGEQSLKNIERPVRVYTVTPGSNSQALRPGPVVASKPSIAVLPFTNMSGDPEQEYFADGIVEDIITALSRFSALFVIARNSTFTYKGRAVDVKQVGRELGVRYVLEGSVRKAGNRVRITGQLIDAATGAHLWADRFEGDLEDVFDLQDQVTASVVGNIAPKLDQAEIERARLKPTGNLNAYDHYLRGIAALHQWTREGNAEALSNFSRAIELDGSYASAYGNAARCYQQRKAGGWVTDRVHEISETARLAELAVRYGKEDAVALCTAGMALAFVVGDLGNGGALIDKALVLNPNLAWAWMFSGWVKIWSGEVDEGIERASRAIRLSPQDTQMFAMQTAIAAGHLFAGRLDEALPWAEAAMREQPQFVVAVCVVAASAALADRMPEAKGAMARLRQLNSSLRLSDLRELLPIQRQEHLAKMVEGLRRAGLPE